MDWSRGPTDKAVKKKARFALYITFDLTLYANRPLVPSKKSRFLHRLFLAYVEP
jgi:hypothetical protein